MFRFVFFVAKRYLFSRGRVRAVHLVGLIATVAISLIVAASIVILSVFNGYGELLIKGASVFDADLLIKPQQGQYSTFEGQSIKEILKNDAITWYAPILYGEGLISSYNGQFCPAKFLGIDSLFSIKKNLDTLLYKGVFDITKDNVSIGSELYMELTLPREADTLTLIQPRRTKKINPLAPYTSLQQKDFLLAGVIHSNNEQYNRTLFLSRKNLRSMLELSPKQASALAIYLTKEAKERLPKIKKEWQNKLSQQGYIIKDQYEQQPELTKLVSMEKWFSYAILVFIMILATFNVICSSSLLILEKQRDRFLFSSLGASLGSIRKIFLGHTGGITFIGVLVGAILGILLCILQQTYGFATYSIGTTAVPYPIKILWSDLISIVGMLLLLSFIATWLPSRFLISKKKSLPLHL